jgi:hypothetical protein
LQLSRYDDCDFIIISPSLIKMVGIFTGLVFLQPDARFPVYPAVLFRIYDPWQFNISPGGIILSPASYHQYIRPGRKGGIQSYGRGGYHDMNWSNGTRPVTHARELHAAEIL